VVSVGTSTDDEAAGGVLRKSDVTIGTLPV
jgi:hypothetical protein